jgi:hypothetical protein
MAGYVPEEHSHLTGGIRDAVQWSATKVGDTAPRLDFEHQTESCGLTGTGSAEECRDAAGSGFEGEVVHGGRTAAVGGAEASLLSREVRPLGGRANTAAR